jgi:hypothetical protein
MSTAMLLLAGTLGLTAPPEPDEPAGEDLPSMDVDEPKRDTDGDTDDTDEPESADEPEPDEASDDPAEAAPSRTPPPSTPGSIPTEGKSKPPPSAEALDRDNPLAQPDATRRDRAGRPGTPQRFALEFKMGPFLPDVDREYSGAGLGPYAMVFGRTDSTGAAIDQPRAFPMPVVAFDWQFVYLAGPLGVGVQAGFFRDKAQALIADPLPGENLRSAADKTSFAMIPLALLLSYRFELMADRLRVPLVPYAKAGLAYSLYWNKSGSGNLARNSRGEAALGGVPGFQANVGAMLRMDFIEPGTAKKLDVLTGINHTYLFGEFQYSRVDNFGVGRSISLGDSTWFAGLAIEF